MADTIAKLEEVKAYRPIVHITKGIMCYVVVWIKIQNARNHIVFYLKPRFKTSCCKFDGAFGFPSLYFMNPQPEVTSTLPLIVALSTVTLPCFGACYRRSLKDPWNRVHLLRSWTAIFVAVDDHVKTCTSFENLCNPMPFSVFQAILWMRLFSLPLCSRIPCHSLTCCVIFFSPSGWFNETCSQSPVSAISLLRMDGDLFESTWDVLVALYDRVLPGGFIYVDDYGGYNGCQVGTKWRANIPFTRLKIY